MRISEESFLLHTLVWGELHCGYWTKGKPNWSVKHDFPFSHKENLNSSIFHRHTWVLTEMLSCRSTFCQQRFLKIHFQLIKELFSLYRNESRVICAWCRFQICRKWSRSKRQPRKDGEQEGLCGFLKHPKWVSRVSLQMLGRELWSPPIQIPGTSVPSEPLPWLPLPALVLAAFTDGPPLDYWLLK